MDFEGKKVDVRYERVLLYLLGFEIAFSANDKSNVFYINEKIQTEIQLFPDSFHSSRKYKFLKNVADTLPFYILVQNRDLLGLNKLAATHELKLNNRRLQVETFSEFEQYKFTTYLLINIVSGDDYTSSFLKKYCLNSEQLLDHHKQAMLSVLFSVQDCPVIQETNRMYPNIIRTFKERYDELVK